MRVIRALILAVLSAVVASVIVYFMTIRPKIRAWGVDPEETELPLPGDDLIADPTALETRGVTIEAPVAQVWPWLVQMGFGRAGWYSYDVLDNKGKHAEGILPEFQDLHVGDIMPTHDGGGFAVKTVEPERALVLYTDTELVRGQAEKAEIGESKVTASYPEFRASWAFIVQPTEDGNTRLIERFRAKTPGNAPANAVLGEIMGTGIVLMTRKQMLGIKERVEHPTLETTEMTPDLNAGHEPQIDIPELIGNETEPTFAG